MSPSFIFPFTQYYYYYYADQFTSLLENHPEYALVFHNSHHRASLDATNINLDQDIQSVHLQSNAPGMQDHSVTVTSNGQTSAGYSYSRMTQPANENYSSLSVMVEAEVIQPSLPHAVQTTVTVNVEIEEC